MKRSRFSSILIALLVLGSPTGVFAQDNFKYLFNPRLGQLSPTASMSGRFDEQADTKRQERDFAFQQYKLDLMFPLRQDEQSELALTGGLGVLDSATTASLLDAGEKFPDHLWHPYLGGFYRKVLDEGKLAGAILKLGSPSDKPFHSIHEVAVNASAFLRVPDQGRNGWYYFLNFSNNRSFLNNIPLPGIAYQQQHSRTLQTILGAPLCSLRWQPCETITAEAMYLFVRTLHAKVTYELSERAKLYSGFDWQNQRWLRAGRDDHDDRIFYYEKRVTIGVDVALTQSMRLDIHGGYGFDRFFFEGDDYGDRDENRISLTDGPFAGVATHLRF